MVFVDFFWDVFVASRLFMRGSGVFDSLVVSSPSLGSENPGAFFYYLEEGITLHSAPLSLKHSRPQAEVDVLLVRVTERCRCE